MNIASFVFYSYLGLDTHLKNTEIIKNNARNNKPIPINGERLQDLDTFTYLVSIITTSTVADEGVTSKISKASHVFATAGSSGKTL